METNVNFRNDLKVNYLFQLAKIENVTEFEKFYPSTESYLIQVAGESRDVAMLNKINEILAFRKKSLGKQL